MQYEWNSVTFIKEKKRPEKTKDRRQGSFKLTESSYASMIHTRPGMYGSANYSACKDFASLMVWSVAVGCIVMVTLINLVPSSGLIFKCLLRYVQGHNGLCVCVCVPIWNVYLHRIICSFSKLVAILRVYNFEFL